MFISKRLVYLQMQKTGSTHITKVFKKFCSGHTHGKHEQLTNYHEFKDRLIVSSVRNPWDWYVSLWAFGCAGGGGLAKYLTHLPLNEVRHAARHRDLAGTAHAIARLFTQLGRRPDWKGLYADPASEANFREWLKLLLGAEGRHIAKEGYAASPVNRAIGFMTYRFLALTTEYGQWNAVGRKAQSLGDVSVFADNHTIASRIMRTESLNDDLLAVLRSIDLDITLDDLEAIGKTNISTHRKYSDYYDDETYRLVAERDRFIIDRFGYQMF